MGLPTGKTPELLADFVNEQPMKVKIIIDLIIGFIIVLFFIDIIVLSMVIIIAIISIT